MGQWTQCTNDSWSVALAEGMQGVRHLGVRWGHHVHQLVFLVRADELCVLANRKCKLWIFFTVTYQSTVFYH